MVTQHGVFNTTKYRIQCASGEIGIQDVYHCLCAWVKDEMKIKNTVSLFGVIHMVLDIHEYYQNSKTCNQTTISISKQAITKVEVIGIIC